MLYVCVSVCVCGVNVSPDCRAYVSSFTQLKWIEKGKTNYSDFVAKFSRFRLRFDGCVHFLLLSCLED